MQLETIITLLATNFQLLANVPADILCDEDEEGEEVITAMQSLTGLAGLHHTGFLRQLQDAETVITLAYVRAQAIQRIRRARRQKQQDGRVAHASEDGDDLLTRRKTVLRAIAEAAKEAWAIMVLHSDQTFGRTILPISHAQQHIAVALHFAQRA